MEQLALIEKHKQWFNKNGISATINVDDHILNILLRPEIKNLVDHIGCVHFEVTENSNKLLNNALATWSDPQSTTLWLDDFGSGNAGINAIRGYHFDYVKIDKDFFWHLMQKDSGRPLMDALITFLSRNHHNVIIEGVESEAHKSGYRAWSGLLFRDTTGRKSALNNWSKKISRFKNAGAFRHQY
jgi:EAL domain-containing protein (putative c-di-GMP-specific phosphodiesterase class I)